MEKYRGKCSPNILADYCWSLIGKQLATVKLKRKLIEFLLWKYFAVENPQEETFL
jgi:hypothetical protein